MREPAVHPKIVCVCLCAALQAGIDAQAWAQAEAPKPSVGVSSADDESSRLPPSAEAALEQAEAAYEYGDMPMVVESSRVVTDGTLRATKEQRAQALRLLGIGLYVTGRIEGAQTAFEQLMQLAPQTQLNPATTRPEIVTFFYQIRRSRIEELRQAHEASRPNAALCLLPPTVQFLNGEHTKAWVLLIAEAATLITTTATFVVGYSWRQGDGTVCKPGMTLDACKDRQDTYANLRTVQRISAGAFALTYAYGVVDALISRNREPSEEELLKGSSPRVSVALLPNGAALSLRF